MKKSLVIGIIVCFLLFGLMMCGCKPISQKEINEEGIEEALKYNIEEDEYIKLLKAYNAYVPEDSPHKLRDKFLNMSAYFGEYDGIYVFSVDKKNPALSVPLQQRNIGNHSYIYIDDILVYFDNVVYKIEDAYKQQILSEDLIGKICSKHRELFPKFYEVELYPAEEDAVSLQEALEERFGNMTNKYYYHIYFGKYNGYMVFYVPRQFPSVTKKIIGEIEFYCPTSFELETFKDGEFSTLEEIYESGNLTKEDIQKICDLFDGIINTYGKNY